MINKESMIKHGTVAFITMFGVGWLFGVKNMMIAFPIALTSAVLSRQNFKVKTFEKILKIIILDLLIVTIAFISSSNVILGLFLNFITMFLIMYTIVSPYDPTFYKPFIMLYVFTQYASVTLSELPNRFLAVIFGVLVVVLGSFIYRGNDKKILGKSVSSSLELLIKQLDNIKKGSYDDKLSNKCSNIMRALAYKIYITRHKKYLTTNIGKIQFTIYISIEYFNLLLKEVYELYNKGEISKSNINKLKSLLNSILEYSMGEINEEKIRDIINNYVIIINENLYLSKKISTIILGILSSIEELGKLKKRSFNKVYKEWETTGLDSTKNTFMEYFHPDTIRFNFAMRMSISLTIALLLSDILGFYKMIWVVITIMSVMQAYYEDTISRTKERVIGNVIAIISAGVFINIINIRWVTILILIGSLYLIYAFKEYYKISIFTSIASLCIASLSENINVLIFYRVVYVIIGAILVLIANKILFPYKLKDGIESLQDKINRYKNFLIEYKDDEKLSKKDEGEIRDIIIHIALLSQKLYLRNIKYGKKEVEDFIYDTNKFNISFGYEILSKNNI